MSWLVVNSDNKEYIYSEQPVLEDGEFVPQKCIYHYDYDNVDMEQYDNFVELPKGSIKRLIGKELTFEESPYKLLSVNE